MNEVVYVVAKYYIGPMNRYDGSGNTDTASITLYRNRDDALNYIIDDINETIAEDNENYVDPKDMIKLTNIDYNNMIDELNRHGIYNYEHQYMYTLEQTNIL